MTCPHCVRKDEIIRDLTRELGLRKSDGELGALMVRLGVTATQARLLMLLYAAKGRPVPHGVLIEELPLDGDQAALKAHAHNIRVRVGQDAIIAAKGFGYGLSAAGLSLVLGALSPEEVQDAREA